MVKENIVQVADLKAALKTLEANQIYPIARIVTFKDNMMSDKHPELSFHSWDQKYLVGWQWLSVY